MNNVLSSWNKYYLFISFVYNFGLGLATGYLTFLFLSGQRTIDELVVGIVSASVIFASGLFIYTPPEKEGVMDLWLVERQMKESKREISDLDGVKFTIFDRLPMAEPVLDKADFDYTLYGGEKKEEKHHVEIEWIDDDDERQEKG